MADYAVVRFLAEDTASEVPRNWLFDKGEQHLCWWPKNSKNVTSLIANKATPNPKTWGQFVVQIEAYCSTLDKARKRAVDRNYITTDDEQLGRGLRQTAIPLVHDSSDDSSTAVYPKKQFKRGDKFKLTKPPSLPDKFNISTMPIVFEDEPVFDLSTIDHDILNSNFTEDIQDCSEEMRTASHETFQQLEMHSNALNFQKKIPTITEVRVINPARANDYNTEKSFHSMNPEINRKVDTNSDSIDVPVKDKPNPTKIKVIAPKTTNYSIKVDNFINRETLPEADINLGAPNKTQTTRNIIATEIQKPRPEKPDLSIQEIFEKLQRMIAAINVNLISINNRLEKMETGINIEHDVYQSICDYLPLITVESITFLEDILHKNKDQVVAQFKKLVLRTGGDSPKDNIQRVLKKVFSNYCAAHATWKGKGENNFGVNDLLTIRIIRDALCSTHLTLKERDFDKITAEWFRFGKQRLNRERLLKDKATAEN